MDLIGLNTKLHNSGHFSQGKEAQTSTVAVSGSKRHLQISDQAIRVRGPSQGSKFRAHHAINKESPKFRAYHTINKESPLYVF